MVIKNSQDYIKVILTSGVTLVTALAILYLLFMVVSPFTYILLSAFIISVLLRPVYDYFYHRLGFGKSLSSLISIAVFLIVLFIPISFIVTSLVNEIKDLLSGLQYGAYSQDQIINTILFNLNRVGVNSSALEAEFSANVSSYLRLVLTNLTAVLSSTVTFIINTALTVVVVYYFLAYRDLIKKFLYSVNPVKKEILDNVLVRGSDVVMATVKGGIFNVLIHFIAGLTGFILFGVSSPVLLGILFGLFSLVPNVGIGLVWVPTVIALFISENYFGAAGLAIWCITANFVIDNMVSPKVIGDATGIHPVLILFGIMGGLHAFGIFGLILGPTIIALSFIAFGILKELLKE